MTKGMRFGSIVLAIALLLTMLCSIPAALADECEPGQHKFDKYEIVKQPTCTEDGSRKVYCSICGYYYGEEPIIHVGHQASEPVKTRTKEPTCLEPGEMTTTTLCIRCGVTMSTSTSSIPALGHDYGEWKETKAPTCTADGEETRICSRDASHKETRVKKSLGHDWGNWIVTKPATCTADGTETRTCARDASHQESRSIPKLGHDWGPYVVTTQPTCEKPGVETSTCKNDPSHTQTRSVPATGHDWGEWIVTTQPTCLAAGVETRTCKNDPSHTQTRNVPATGHDWGEWVITVKPECEKPGTRTRTCKHDPSHVETESIAPTNHPHTHWVVTIKPTYTSYGERQLICEECEKVIKIERLAKLMYTNNTLCAFGPRLRDVDSYITPYTTDVWYMFTPFDASVEGTQTFELVATNRYIAGTLTIDIRDGNITVDYKLNTRNMDVTYEFFTILNQIQDIHVYEPEQLSALNMKVGRAYNLAENFGDDTNLVLYFCSRINYTIDEHLKDLNYNSAAHQRLVRQMLDMMDK
jgi:hypothetical protein